MTEPAFSPASAPAFSGAFRPSWTAPRRGKWSYRADAVVLVPLGADDAENGANLATAYAEAKDLKPGGLALSAANRACVKLPVANYKLTSTLVLDADYVDLVAAAPQPGGMPSDADDWLLGMDQQPLSMYRPPPTSVYSESGGVTPVRQTAGDLRMRGFAIAYLYNDTAYSSSGQPSYNAHALFVDLATEESNEASVYDMMYFWHRAPYWVSDGDPDSPNTGFPTAFRKHAAGTWRNCIDGAGAMRLGEDGAFRANMRNCAFGPYSVGGDVLGTIMGPCRIENCTAYGMVIGEGSGRACFGGCWVWGIGSLPTAWFIDVTAGCGSFNIGGVAAGKYIRCRVKKKTGEETSPSFGSSNESTLPGEFAGYAEDCVVEIGNAFGAGALPMRPAKLTGKLVRCTILTAANPIRSEGGTIEDCIINVAANNTDCITLLDGNTRITGSTLTVKQGGTGVPVNAASAQTVFAQNCSMNNASNDNDGLGANVTNTADSPNNVVADDVA